MQRSRPAKACGPSGEAVMEGTGHGGGGGGVLASGNRRKGWEREVIVSGEEYDGLDRLENGR